MDAVVAALSLTYRRILTDFVPGLLTILAVLGAGLLPSESGTLVDGHPTWAPTALVVALAFPLGIIVTSLANLLFERLCLLSGALDWLEFLTHPSMTRPQAETDLLALWQRVNGRDHEPSTNDLWNLATLARNTLRLHGTDRVMNLLDRYTGASILCRDVALIALVYMALELMTVSRVRTGLAVGLIGAMPLAAHAAFWVTNSWSSVPGCLRFGAGHRSIMRLVVGVAWIVFWTIWSLALYWCASPMGATAYLLPPLVVLLLSLHTMLARFEAVELVQLVQTAGLFEHLATSEKDRRATGRPT